MLMTIINICVAIISVGLAVFIFYPPPSPSPFVYQLNETAKYHTFDGHRIYYQAYHSDSNQETLFLLHGFPTSSFDFYKIVPELRKNFKNVILVDMLGFGFSDKPMNHDYSITSQADIIESLITALNFDSVHVMAHDYGDTVLQELLARQIDKSETNRKIYIRTACLLNGGIFPETNKPFFIQKVLSAPVIGNLLARLMNYRTFSLRMDDLFGLHTKPSEQELRDMWHLTHKKKGYLLAPSLLTYISQRVENRARWVGALENAKIPILMIYGPADPINPPPFPNYFRKVLPKAEIKVLNENIGHYPQLEDPREVLAAYLLFYNKYVKLSDG